MSKSICLGVIGGGQLGSLLCSAAKKLKVKTVVLSDDKDGPAQHFCDEFIHSKYDDNAKVKEFISKVNFGVREIVFSGKRRIKHRFHGEIVAITYNSRFNNTPSNKHNFICIRIIVISYFDVTS